MKRISILTITFLILGFLFLVLPKNAYSGIPLVPGGPPCCDIGVPLNVCVGGEEAFDACEDASNAGITAQLFDNAICVPGGQGTGNCIVDTAPPTLVPAADVPTLSGWGLMSLAVVLGLLGIGAFLARKKKASA